MEKEKEHQYWDDKKKNPLFPADLLGQVRNLRSLTERSRRLGRPHKQLSASSRWACSLTVNISFL